MKEIIRTVKKTIVFLFGVILIISGYETKVANMATSGDKENYERNNK